MDASLLNIPSADEWSLIAMLTARRCCFCLVLLVVTLFGSAEQAMAQSNAPALPANSQVATRSFYAEGAFVVLLIGGALFAVCRSSRRI